MNNICLISKAKQFATEKHKNQVRKFSGEPYVNHPIRVSQLVLKYSKEDNLSKMVAAALLHDTVEDTDTTYAEIQKEFGPAVAVLVKELTSEPDIKESKAEYLSNKMFMMSDQALLIKLADRLDNVTGIKNTPVEFSQRYIKETKIILESLFCSRTQMSSEHFKLFSEIIKEIS